jgi:hypothetical protein
MPLKSKADVFSPDYNAQPGMNDEQRKADAITWKVDPKMMFEGELKELGCYEGPQVGNPFSGDAMGEERMKITYAKGGKGKTPGPG